MKKKFIYWLLLLFIGGLVALVYWLGPHAWPAIASSQGDQTQHESSRSIQLAENELVHKTSNNTESAEKVEVVTGPNVAVVSAQEQTLGIEVHAVGSLWARESVMLKAEITGTVATIDFQEGTPVDKGKLLLKIDDSLLRAQLQEAQAKLTLKESQFARAQQLSSEGFISVQARDEVASELAVARAQAALAQAQLDKTIIRAPFDGVLGFRHVSIGDYVSPGADLVRIEAIDPLFVEFQIPEQYMSMVKIGTPVILRFDAISGEFFPGQIDAIDPALDAQGRSLRLRARVPNPDGHLRAGMFARVQAQVEQHQAVMVPEAAIAPSAGEQF